MSNMDQQSTAISGLARDGRAVLSAHGAFDDPTVPADVLPRASVELRAIAFHPA
jgi:hypothetical protein